ncbi:MAG: hypothetical protein GX794_01885 [Acholeplasmataceae bacterium]|nr:hypothetical protein [Acholeplasmataceae bacterium]
MNLTEAHKKLNIYFEGYGDKDEDNGIIDDVLTYHITLEYAGLDVLYRIKVDEDGLFESHFIFDQLESDEANLLLVNDFNQRNSLLTAYIDKESQYLMLSYFSLNVVDHKGLIDYVHAIFEEISLTENEKILNLLFNN